MGHKFYFLGGNIDERDNPAMWDSKQQNNDEKNHDLSYLLK